ncbi:thiamine-phosphate kinase [Halothece sp. PCC 7418]|uniref:thiamine-phosphate kinase n=1 Tax=Halothece sp. (strain PCC 7418) TaxID=65093 RepID=UPI0002A08463|nr:thiamine-phosphate kinase [Halothece sp. PCC 7418]AFZ44129.1 thiamine-phosphate kinase [Halothece sp. PCC 7418]
MTSEAKLTVADIGEQGLLAKLHRFCSANIVGDDAAVINWSSDHSLVVTTDVLVDGVHFSDGMAQPNVHTTTPEDVGWRAVAANLSDLAAMGATPCGITVGLSLPKTVPVGWVERLYQGLSECLEAYEAVLWGGDVTCSSLVTIAISAIGKIDPQRVIRRQDAKVGDVILVTGEHGLSRAGLELLLHPQRQSELDAVSCEHLIHAHQRPQPRLDILPLLWEILPEFRVAGMDSSDGLADAILQICRASGVGAKVDLDLLPIPPALSQWVSPEQAIEWALYGGEDFELVLALPREAAKQLEQKSGNPTRIIGEITSQPQVEAKSSLLSHNSTLNLSQGFQHWGL